MTDRPDYMWQGEELDEIINVFETRSERLRRHLSIIIINTVGFVNMLGFSIVLTGAYPYLLQIDEHADKVLLGWIIAANPLGQLISSPLVGWLGNRWKTVRWLCMASGFLNCVGFIMYACLEALPQPRRFWMMSARFIIGLAAGSITLCITYISKATTTRERTTFISINALAQTLGFIIGPAIQTALIPLGPQGVPIGFGGIHFNMYTSAGWLAAVLAVVYMTLFSPCIFREYDMAEKEVQWTRMNNINRRETTPINSSSNQKNDLIGALLCIFNFAVAAFIIIMIESLATPMAMDLLAFSEEEAVVKVGILLSVSCILTAVAFALSGPLARRLTERRVLLFFGLLPLFVGQIIMLPYGGPTPLMQTESKELQINQTANVTVALALVQPSVNGSNSSSIPRGCPVVQEWCLYTPAVYHEQLVTGFVITAVAYAFTAAMSTSTLTQVIGPGQQGTWTGMYLAGGSLSRILSPLLLNKLYTSYGTWATFGFTAGLLCLVITANLTFRSHLVPLVHRNKRNLV